MLYLLYLLPDWRRWTGRWSWHLWLDEEENTSRWASLHHLWQPSDYVSLVKLYFHSSCCSGGRGSLLRGWVHCGQWCYRTRLADEAQREAVAAGKNVWQLLPSRPCISNHRRCERWAGTRNHKNINREKREELKTQLSLILSVRNITELTSCSSFETWFI